MTVLTKEDVRRKTTNLLRIHGYGGVSVFFHEDWRRAGTTMFIYGRPTMISYSRPHILAQADNFLQIIKHECAHVLAGELGDHDSHWEAQVKKLGGTPRVRWDWDDLVYPEVIFSWKYACPSCEKTVALWIEPVDTQDLTTTCCSVRPIAIDLRAGR